MSTSMNADTLNQDLRHKSKVRVYPYTVVENSQVGDGIWRLVVDSPDLAADLRPGQFMNFKAPGAEAHITRVPLSFAEADVEAGTVEIVYATVGPGTRALSALVPGDVSELLGPCGHGWKLPEAGPAAEPGRCLLVAGGVGAPPVVAATRMLAEAGYACDVILGARTKDALWGEEAAAQAGASRVLVCTDDGSYGRAGFTTDAAGELLSEGTYTCIYTCGPSPMMAGVARLAESHGIPCQASLERMMGCGFGACSTCNVALVGGGYASCCSDGPVFDAKEVAW